MSATPSLVAAMSACFPLGRMQGDSTSSRSMGIFFTTSPESGDTRKRLRFFPVRPIKATTSPLGEKSMVRALGLLFVGGFGWPAAREKGA